MSKEELLEMFRDNKYKQHIIKDKIPDGTSTTVYRCGPLIDLCRGPHVPHTGRIKAFEIMKVCSILESVYVCADKLKPRILLPTFLVIRITIRCSVSMAFLSQIKSRWKNTRNTLKKPPSEIIGRLERSKSSSSSTSSRLDPAFSSHTASVSTTLFRPSCAQSTGSEGMTKLPHPTCTMPSYGRPRATGNTTRTTCLPSRWRRISLD